MIHKLIVTLSLFCVLLSFTPSSVADELPFFITGNKIDKKNWLLSHGWTNGEHQSCEWRDNAVRGVDGRLTLTLSERGGKHRPFGCGEIQSNATYGYGRYEARMRSAKGYGLNSAFFTYIGQPHQEEHDEIDFEFLGRNPYVVEVTHWRNGIKGPVKQVRLGYDSSEEFHNYAFEWDKDEIRWYVDDKLVYKTDGSFPVPIHKQKIFFSLWSNAPSLDDWMGRFKYYKPVSAEVEWVKFTPFDETEMRP